MTTPEPSDVERVARAIHFAAPATDDPAILEKLWHECRFARIDQARAAIAALTDNAAKDEQPDHCGYVEVDPADFDAKGQGR